MLKEPITTLLNTASYLPLLALLSFTVCFYPATAQAGQVTLTWDANTQSTLGGYKLYYGPTTGNYTTSVDVGKQTTYTVANLANGTYYFAATAYDNSVSKTQSGYSNEICTTIGSATNGCSTGGGTTPPPTGGTTAPALSSPWVGTDIGDVGLAGSSTRDASGTFTLKGAGNDIWDTADAFRFAYQPLSGDGSIVARVASIDNTDSWAKAGVMIRESTDFNARHAMVAVTPGNGVTFQRRTATGGASADTTGADVAAPYWVKLTRAGSTFTASQSADGSNWTPIGSATISMATNVYVGLAVTSHNDSVLNTATLNNVSVLGGSTSSTGPVANFSASPTTGTAPLRVTFTNTSTSTGTVSYNWDFGDGVTSNLPNPPAHDYTTGRTLPYTVKLTATGSGSSSTKTTDIKVTASSGTGSTPDCSSTVAKSIWSPTAIPATPTDPDTAAIELGVKFRADVSGFICGIRFYKGSTNTGTHIGKLWTSSGQLLTSATFQNETASGWQQVNFAIPVAVTANTVYVASYNAPNGRYADDTGYFVNVGVDNGVLHALRDGVSGSNGAYSYGNGVFPASAWKSSNYWVDVVFTDKVK